MARKETYDFWVGTFNSRDDYFDFVGEDPAYYQDQRDMEEKYISKFAESQGENWIDHDFMESGFQNEKSSFAEKFSGHSYSNQWIPELSLRIDGNELEAINVVVFLTKGEINKPISVAGPKFSLRYMGQIECNI